ncbi:sulfate/molybdate ABC transporter ATP-binding protein [Brachybacterium sp. DNPG3]
MSLQIHASVPERGVQIDLELDLVAPTGAASAVAIVGPNGAGKSTLLQLVAGLLRPRDGRIVLDGRVLAEVEAGRTRTWVPVHARRIATLSQDPLLLPHLTALGNVVFALRSQGVSRRGAAARARALLAELGLAEFADRRPSQLSGGQAQRIAIARAIAAEPSLLLLDEPMAALDVDVAPVIREQLDAVLETTPALLVTHDVLDAITLAEQIAVIESGAVVSHGPALAQLARPSTTFAARFAGLNMLTGVWADGAVELADGGRLPGGSGHADGESVRAVFRPSAVRLLGTARETPPAASHALLHRTVRRLEPHGDLVRVRTEDLSADLAPHRIAELGLRPGDAVRAVIPAEDVSVHAVSGRSAAPDEQPAGESSGEPARV